MLWPNACQWLRSGKTAVHTLTETHDSDDRAAALNKPGERAWFGTDVAYPTGATYNASDLTDKTGVTIRPTGVEGFRLQDQYGVHIVEPATRSRDRLRETIIHEVQHDLDNPSGDSWSRFTSEFRAYWVTGEFNRWSARKGSADAGLEARDGTPLAGFKNARQQAIFHHLYSGASYNYVRALWADEVSRQAILDLEEPAGMNLIVSPRIEHFYRVTRGEAGETDEDFKAAVDALTKEDAAAMQSKGSKRHWEFWLTESALGLDRMRYIRDHLGNGKWPPN